MLKAAYLDAPARPMPVIPSSLGTRLMALTLIALIVGIGFYPTALFDLVQAAVLRLP